jgi:hypothetical protein
MAALVLALAQAAKANAAAQAQWNQQTILAVVPRIQQLAALAKAQRTAQAAPALAAPAINRWPRLVRKRRLPTAHLTPILEWEISAFCT